MLEVKSSTIDRLNKIINEKWDLSKLFRNIATDMIECHYKLHHENLED